MEDMLSKYMKQIQAEQSGVKRSSPGEIPSFEEASFEFGWNNPPQANDSVTGLLQGIMGTQNNPYGAVSDDLRAWYNAATDYAEKLGHWPDWEILSGIGVPVGQPYQPADLSPAIGTANEHTSGLLGVESGQPVTEQMFKQYQGSQDYQTFTDEARRTQQIMEIMKATNYDAQTASYIYDTFMNDMGFEGGSAWAKGMAPDKMKDVTKQMKDVYQAEEGKPTIIDDEALNEFYKTGRNYSQKEDFGPSIQSMEIRKMFPERGEYQGPFYRNKAFDIDLYRDNYYTPSVDLINSFVNEARQSGNLASLIGFIREAGITDDDVFSMKETISALRWLDSRGYEKASNLLRSIEQDDNLFGEPPAKGLDFSINMLQPYNRRK